MSNHLIVCLVIFVLTCAGYMANVWSIATIAIASVAGLSFTGCLPPREVLACFSNEIVIMIGAMSVVAAGFNKTRFCSELAAGITRIVGGNRRRVLLLYCVLTMLLSQIVQSPVVVYGIVAPFCMATADSMGIPRSKIALPLGVVAISTCSTLPVGTGATQAAERLHQRVLRQAGGLLRRDPRPGVLRSHAGPPANADLHCALLHLCHAALLPRAHF